MPNTLTSIHIKHESPAERCEICHQPDMFDPQSGKCARCDSVNTANLVAHSDTQLQPVPIPAFLRSASHERQAPVDEYDDMPISSQMAPIERIIIAIRRAYIRFSNWLINSLNSVPNRRPPDSDQLTSLNLSNHRESSESYYQPDIPDSYRGPEITTLNLSSPNPANNPDNSNTSSEADEHRPHIDLRKH